MKIAADLFRRESGRLVAMLPGQFGTHRLQLAEEVVQEALVRALQTWPYRGVPDKPAARLPARTDEAGNLLRLHEQDRTAWNHAMMARGLHYLSLASQGDHVGQ